MKAYSSNTASKMGNETDRLKENVDNRIIIVGDFNIPLLIIDRKSRQKISKDIEDLKNSSRLCNLIDTCRIFHWTTAEITFISGADGIFSRIDQMLDSKISLSTFQRNVVVQYYFNVPWN